MQAWEFLYAPSARPVSLSPRRSGQNPNAKKKQNSGLNENYGRELLELHTLSVNGAIAARRNRSREVFTGWTIDKPNDGGGFKFDPKMHEPAEVRARPSHQTQG